MSRVYATLAALMIAFAACGAPRAADLMEFWDSPQYGGNSFNAAPPDAEHFEALAGYGASWVRLAYDKWDGEARDFLMGDAGAYAGLVEEDLAVLVGALDRAHAAGLKVVIAPLSLPGGRWRQNNDGAFDDRLWSDKKWQDAAAAFWRDLAGRLKDHPAIAAYNIVNEPAPELKGGLDESAGAAEAAEWGAAIAGSARDLPAFYETVIAAIRAVDAKTPVMVDGGLYASAAGFQTWPRALDDDRVLYAFHMYEPWAATSSANLKREAPYDYPGVVPFAGGEMMWDAERVAAWLRQPADWARANGVSESRLVAGEFGCMRRLAWCPLYLEDVLAALDAQGTHWAFYAFREDVWDGMDYELGDAPLPGSYWAAAEKGEDHTLERGPTAQFEPIRRRLEAAARRGETPARSVD